MGVQKRKESVSAQTLSDHMKSSLMLSLIPHYSLDQPTVGGWREDRLMPARESWELCGHHAGAPVPTVDINSNLLTTVLRPYTLHSSLLTHTVRVRSSVSA
jgi:hypothetical protein